MAGELGTDFVSGLQNQHPDWLRFQAWLQAQRQQPPGDDPAARAAARVRGPYRPEYVAPLPAQPTQPVQSSPLAPPPTPEQVQQYLGQQPQAQPPQPWQGASPRVKPAPQTPEQDFGTALGQIAQLPPAQQDNLSPAQRAVYGATESASNWFNQNVVPAIPPELRPQAAAVAQAVNAVNPVAVHAAYTNAMRGGHYGEAALNAAGLVPGEAIGAGLVKLAGLGKAALAAGAALPAAKAATTGDVAARAVSEPRMMSPLELQRSGAMWQHAEPGRPVQPILPGDTRVSTRFPKAVGSTEDPLRTHLSIGSDEMRLNTPDKQGRGGFEHNVNLLREYPGFGRLKNMDDLEAVAAYLKQAQENMQYLYDRSPQMMKERSPLWYEGAHEIAGALANRWGVPRRSASASLASLSPQMDWFKNASLGERVGDTMTSAAAGRPMTPQMLDYARAKMGTGEGQFLKPGSTNLEIFRQIEGKTLDELQTPLQKAMWIRMYDEAHNPRPYRSITPEGNFGDWILTDEGKLERVGWGSFGEIQKAVRAMESGGDMDIISRLLGGKHKVRSFYNNIERPNDPRFGDVTGDTHQVAAAQMRPLSGKSAAVEHNLASGSMKGRPGASSSDVTGVQGTYGWTADATRRFAQENDLLPRAGQSATWEPVRELFTDTWKRGMQPGGKVSNPDAVDAIWSLYDAGQITAQQARDRIFDLAGGIGTPEWGRPGLRTTAPNQGSTYR